MFKELILLLLLSVGGLSAMSQAVGFPRIRLEFQDTMLVDITSGNTLAIPAGQKRFTNYNPSVYLGDTVLPIAYDSLRTDGAATVVTVYETDADSVVGLWQVGSRGNRALWLNSQSASYEDFDFRYREETEKGVVIHTMTYRYPEADSDYDGHDTLFLGTDGNVQEEKNLCALYYYPGHLGRMQQRVLESALAIRFGALLHGAYINSLGDTLWHPLGDDSLHSHGVCGIGRDDSLSLHQRKSAISGDLLSIEAIDTIGNRVHVMMGHDGGELVLNGKTVVIDGKIYSTVGREWKMRPHGDTVLVRMFGVLPWPTGGVKLMLTVGDSSLVVQARGHGTAVFDSIAIRDGVDCRFTLLIDRDSVPGWDKGAVADTPGDYGGANRFDLSVLPNPTTGNYRVEVIQEEIKGLEVRIIDSNGRIVEQCQTGDATHYTHQGAIATDGAYYVTVTGNGIQKTVKLIVSK